MRGGAPPDLQTAQIIQNTAAVANTNTTTTILAAPGATRRYRLWGYQFGFNTSLAAAGAVAHALIRGNPGITIRYDAFVSRDATGVFFIWTPGGIVCLTNSLVEVVDRCTVATQGIFHRVFYIVEEEP